MNGRSITLQPDNLDGKSPHGWWSTGGGLWRRMYYQMMPGVVPPTTGAVPGPSLALSGPPGGLHQCTGSPGWNASQLHAWRCTGGMPLGMLNRPWLNNPEATALGMALHKFAYLGVFVRNDLASPVVEDRVNQRLWVMTTDTFLMIV